MKNPASLSLVLVLLFCASCSNSLSRDKAKALINASDQFAQIAERTAALEIDRDSFNQGVQRGYWESVNPNDAEAHITRAGGKFFSRVFTSSPSGKGLFLVYAHVRLNPSVVEVTGISESKVEFTYVRNVDQLPPEIRDIFREQPPPSKGRAIVRLYDDGWRVVEIEW